MKGLDKMNKALRKRWLQLITYILLFSIVSMMVVAPVAQAVAILQPDIKAQSAILLEAKTGKILFEQNADTSLPTASMSKMMTEYLVLEAIKKGQFDWDTVVRTSEYAHFLGTVGSRVWLAEGEERTVEELYTGMAVYSGNDTTAALAELVGGTEEAFVQMMNAKAAELGMKNTKFVNSTGLPNRLLKQYMHTGTEEEENLMSARDTAILARALINTYPEVLQFSSIPEKPKEYLNVRLVNWNMMLEGHPYPEARQYTYPGVDGLKTGNTDAAGYCFTGTAERDGMRLISVVMNTDSITARFVETKKLFDYGYNNFELKEMAKKGQKLKKNETFPVIKGVEKEVSVVVGEPLTIVIHKDEADLYSLEVVPNKKVVDKEGNIIAPIKKGDEVGKVKLTYKGEATIWLSRS